jgi:hypothetical protein
MLCWGLVSFGARGPLDVVGGWEWTAAMGYAVVSGSLFAGVGFGCDYASDTADYSSLSRIGPCTGNSVHVQYVPD